MSKARTKFEDEFYERSEAVKTLKAAQPVGGLITIGDLKFGCDVRDQLIADLKQEMEDLILQELEANPKTYARFPGGKWGLRKHLPTLVTT